MAGIALRPQNKAHPSKRELKQCKTMESIANFLIKRIFRSMFIGKAAGGSSP